MAFTKITNADFNDNGALSMPNRPSETKSAQEIKRLFDAPAREVVAPAYNRLIDELEAETGAASLGAVAPLGARGNTVQEILNGVYGAISTAVIDVREIKDAIEELSEEVGTFSDDIDALEAEAHSHPNKSLIDSYEQTESDLADAVAKKHTHPNKDVLDKFAESSGNPTYDGNPIGSVSSVNGQTGTVVLDASDVGALPSSTTIPDSLSDLSDDSTHRLVTDTEKTAWNGKSVVSVTQVQTTGTKIATVTVDETETDIYAPEGGAGSGDMKKSDYDSDTTVKNAGGIKTYVSSQIAGLMVKNTYDSDSAVANAGGIARYVSSQISAQITSALTASY